MNDKIDFRRRENLHLLPTPRKVAFPILLWEMFGGTANMLLWGMVVMMTMLFVTFGMPRNMVRAAAVAISSDTAHTEGLVVDTRDVGLSEDVGGIAMVFEYEVDGRSYRSRSVWSELHPEYERMTHVLDRGPVSTRVEYLSALPSISRLPGASWTESSIFKLLFGLFGMIGVLVFPMRNAWLGLKRYFVLREGLVGPAVLRNIEEAPSETALKHDPHFKYTFQLTASDGSYHEVHHVGPKSDGDRLTDDRYEPVLYLAEDPSQHVLFDSRKDIVSVTQSGDFVCAAPAMAYGALGLPLLVVLSILADAWGLW